MKAVSLRLREAQPPQTNLLLDVDVVGAADAVHEALGVIVQLPDLASLVGVCRSLGFVECLVLRG